MKDFVTIINSDKPTLVDFHASWCGPCRLQGPIIDDVKKRVGDDVVILKIDVDGNSRLAAQYDVRSVPTLIIFKNGEPVWRESGLHSADDIEAALRHFI